MLNGCWDIQNPSYVDYNQGSIPTKQNNTTKSSMDTKINQNLKKQVQFTNIAWHMPYGH